MKKQAVSVTLGGQKRTLQFDLETIEAWEKVTTYTAPDGTVVRGSALNGLTPRSTVEFTALVWAALRSHQVEAQDTDHPQGVPSLRDVRGWLIEEGAMERIFEDVMEAMGESNPTPEDVEALSDEDEGDEGLPDPTRTEAGTGSETPTPSQSSNSD